ncbi:hypothetical protein K2X33_05015 [bacterium]|nr:hypothetical protein [bacterium]
MIRRRNILNFTVRLALVTTLSGNAWADDTFFTPPPPSQQPTQQPEQQSDRKEGASAAQALGMVGAAISGVSCVMLLKQARETTDPAMKAMLQAQGLDQCAQAAKSAQSAAENGDSKQMLTSTETPSSNLPTTPDDPTSEDKDPTLYAPPTDNTPPTQVADVDSPKDPDPAVFDPPANPSLNVAGAGGPNLGTANLSPITPNQLSFDDSLPGGMSGGGSGSQTPGGMGYGMASGANGAADTRAIASTASGTAGGAKTKRGKAAEDAASVGGGEDGAAGSGAPDMASLFSKIMGGPGEGEGAAGQQLSDLAQAPTGSEKIPNIFEYAGYRIRKARREGALKSGRVAMVKP